MGRRPTKVSCDSNCRMRCGRGFASCRGNSRSLPRVTGPCFWSSRRVSHSFGIIGCSLSQSLAPRSLHSCCYPMAPLHSQFLVDSIVGSLSSLPDGSLLFSRGDQFGGYAPEICRTHL